MWGIDLTGKADVEGAAHPVLGIVDHGSRLAVGLRFFGTLKGKLDYWAVEGLGQLAPGAASYFSAWDGMLTGFHMRR